MSDASGTGQRLRGREQRLLRDLAHHAAAVIAAARLTAELEESRDRLASVREQERRRIWSELHDGLGPLLTGVSFGLEAARNQVAFHTPAEALLTFRHYGLHWCRKEFTHRQINSSTLPRT